MKQTGIIMSGDHPRKILDGTKTMTRRVIKHPEKYEGIRDCGFCCPYGQVGDRLWVRETHALEIVDVTEPNAHYDEESEYHLLPRYKADGFDLTGCCDIEDGEPIGWRPSIFMPRWASRILLEITEVRVERLAEISNEDAKAEGVIPMTCCLPGAAHYITPFKELWDSLNAKRSYGWDKNPWVWVISFKLVSQ